MMNQLFQTMQAAHAREDAAWKAIQEVLDVLVTSNLDVVAAARAEMSAALAASRKELASAQEGWKTTESLNELLLDN